MEKINEYNNEIIKYKKLLLFRKKLQIILIITFLINVLSPIIDILPFSTFSILISPIIIIENLSSLCFFLTLFVFIINFCKYGSKKKIMKNINSTKEKIYELEKETLIINVVYNEDNK